MRRPVSLLVLLAPLAAASAGCGSDGADRPGRALELRPAPAARPAGPRVPVPRPAERPVDLPRARSLARGSPTGGRLANGLQLPPAGRDWVTWDPVLHRVPNRSWRRWGTDRLLALLIDVLRDYRAANAGAPPVLVGDLSRPHGGAFDQRFGGLGHASHQNGLDVDVYYPRRDRLLRGARRLRQVDRRLAQDLVDRFVAAGARFVFVGLRVRLEGPPKVVQAIGHHDDHLHVRIGPG